MKLPFGNKETKEEKELRKRRAELSEEREFSDQVFEIGVRLRGLKRKFEVVIEREKRSILYKQENNKDCSKSISTMKNAYYALVMIDDAQERLVEIANHRDLCKAMNEMSVVFKLMNGLSTKSEKVKDFLLKYRIKRMEQLSENEGETLKKHFVDPIDELVSDDIVYKLIKGASVEECIKCQDGIEFSPDKAREMATIVYEDYNDNFDGHELSVEDIDSACDEWAKDMI